MFYDDHAPPHFHAKYGEYVEAGVVKGRFPRRGLAHVLEWHELHRDELMENWDLARDRRPLRRIVPLE